MSEDKIKTYIGFDNRQTRESATERDAGLQADVSVIQFGSLLRCQV